MSYTYPEWVIPNSVDKAALLRQCEAALATYPVEGTSLPLCVWAYTRRTEYVDLLLTLQDTLGYRNPLTLETVIEYLNDLPHLSLSRNRTDKCERRVEWLNLLKEKLS